MKILVLNCGSSSVKYKLIDTKGEKVLAEGGVEKIGMSDGFLKYKDMNSGDKKITELGLINHAGAIKAILSNLTDKVTGVIENFNEIDAVGHRVVHGGEKFSKSVIIDNEVKKMIRLCYDLAPLHNPANMTGIEAIEEILPDVKQIAVFDTAFHQTMPAQAFMYALPYEYYEKDGVRRYGFHGTSHRYVSQRACEFLGVDIKEKKIITCHIGNGGSITAVKYGKSIDTSMGLTPTEGLMMGTRVGDIDAGAIAFLLHKYNMNAEELQNMINKNSGVLGVSGVSSDMRELEAAIAQGDKRARLALDMYQMRITKYIGAYAAEMGGVDIIVFTGGVGENQTGIRAEVCRPLKFMGVEIDDKMNKDLRGKEAVISTTGSEVTVLVIPTDEELMIARDTESLLS